MKDFLRFMLDGIAIGPNADQSHMSIIQYDHNAAVESTLTGSRTSLEAAIQNMNLLAGGTRIDRALTAAGNELSARARPGSRRVILLVTDGFSASNPVSSFSFHIHLFDQELIRHSFGSSCASIVSFSSHAFSRFPPLSSVFLPFLVSLSMGGITLLLLKDNDCQ